MTPTKEQIIAEANRRRAEHGEGAPPVEHFIVDVVCENWTPPEPVVDPDLLAWREWMASRVPTVAHWYLSGSYDAEPSATAYLAGARMARDQERERAKALVEYVQDRRYEDAQADRIHARYTGRRCDD